MPRHIIFVSGFGDSRGRFYKVLKRAWRSEQAHIYIFGWDEKTTEFSSRYNRFLQYLDSFPATDELCIVGISAGGTVAINALAERPRRIRRVVAICSPLQPFDRYQDTGLKIAMHRVQEVYAAFDDAAKSKIATMHGWHDGVVPIHLTPLPGTQTVRIAGFTHAMNIAVATLVSRGKLRALTRG